MRRVLATLRGFVWVVPLLAACVGSGGRGGGPGPAVRAPGTPLPQADAARTDVVLVAKAPLPAGKNLLWSAGMHLAWDALADAAGVEGRLRLGPPAPPSLVDEMNGRPFPHGDLDEASYVVSAGFAEQGVIDRFRREIARKFPGDAFPMTFPALVPGDAAAFAYVKKDLPFRTPFHVRTERLSLAGGAKRVIAFGLDPDAVGVAAIAAQAVFHGPPEGAPKATPAEFLVELLPRDDADRIVLASIPRPDSLAAGWERAAALRALPGAPLSGAVDLAIPKIDFAAEHAFRELYDAEILDLPHRPYVKDARERIEFTLSELGARFLSASSFTMGCSSRLTPQHIRFETPFLLALVRRDATHPYFLAWFENDDLFVKVEG